MPAHAWLYDLVMELVDSLGLLRFRRRLVGGVRGRTLEVGAGTGLNFPHYEAAASRLIALDVDREGLLRARRRRPSAVLVQADVEALPFRDGAFETVISALVFCSVRRPSDGLREIRRVLSEHGEARLLEHVRPRGKVLGWIADRLTPAWRHIAGGCHLNRDTEHALSDARLCATSSRSSMRGAVVELRARPC